MSQNSTATILALRCSETLVKAVEQAARTKTLGKSAYTRLAILAALERDGVKLEPEPA